MDKVNVNRLIDQLTLIGHLESGDKLAVNKDGSLIVTPKGLTQAALRSFKNMTAGGYNRKAVSETILKLCKQIKEIKKEDIENKYDFVRFFLTLEKACSQVSSIEYSYRPDVFEVTGNYDKKKLKEAYAILEEEKNKYKNDYMEILNKFDALSDDLKKLFQPEYDRNGFPTEQTLDHLARPEYSQVLNKQLLEQIFEHATKHKDSKLKQAKKLVGYILTTLVITLPLYILMGLKVLIWNPLEYLFTGRITSKNPQSWWNETTMYVYDSKNIEAESTIKRCRSLAIKLPLNERIEIYKKHPDLIGRVLGYNFLNDEQFSFGDVDKNLEALKDYYKKTSIKVSDDFKKTLDNPDEVKLVKEIVGDKPVSFRAINEIFREIHSINLYNSKGKSQEDIDISSREQLINKEKADQVLALFNAYSRVYQGVYSIHELKELFLLAASYPPCKEIEMTADLSTYEDITYSFLCKDLEQKGFKLDRSSLKR